MPMLLAFCMAQKQNKDILTCHEEANPVELYISYYNSVIVLLFIKMYVKLYFEVCV